MDCIFIFLGVTLTVVLYVILIIEVYNLSP